MGISIRVQNADMEDLAIQRPRYLRMINDALDTEVPLESKRLHISNCQLHRAQEPIKKYVIQLEFSGAANIPRPFS